MRIDLDLSTLPPTFYVADADDCTALSLRVLPVKHSYVPAEVLRALADAAEVGPGWGDRFSAMLVYADSRGWVRPEDGAVRVHVE
ncbi:hypothetical protein Rruber_05206 (plasmid) [Rhodococcus ruber]|uniref:hypothetical protein n=1 Tax=Rhodococcus ruber TaxID=1830 RepID=UPI00315DDA21